jgi:hypothetical protein
VGVAGAGGGAPACRPSAHPDTASATKTASTPAKPRKARARCDDMSCPLRRFPHVASTGSRAGPGSSTGPRRARRRDAAALRRFGDTGGEPTRCTYPNPYGHDEPIADDRLSVLPHFVPPSPRPYARPTMRPPSRLALLASRCWAWLGAVDGTVRADTLASPAAMRSEPDAVRWNGSGSPRPCRSAEAGRARAEAAVPDPTPMLRSRPLRARVHRPSRSRGTRAGAVRGRRRDPAARRARRRTVAHDGHLYLAGTSPRVVRALELVDSFWTFDRIPDASFAVSRAHPA